MSYKYLLRSRAINIQQVRLTRKFRYVSMSNTNIFIYSKELFFQENYVIDDNLVCIFSFQEFFFKNYLIVCCANKDAINRSRFVYGMFRFKIKKKKVVHTYLSDCITAREFRDRGSRRCLCRRAPWCPASR